MTTSTMLKRRKGFKPKPGIQEMLGSGILQRASSLKAKPKPLRKRADNNPGWYGWAVREVWGKRPHACEVCSYFLADPAPIHFSHLLPRGLYKKYARDERNVVLKCGPCHAKWTAEGDKTKLKGLGWQRIVRLYQELRAEANGVSRPAC